jgi:hypothetical protein
MGGCDVSARAVDAQRAAFSSPRAERLECDDARATPCVMGPPSVGSVSVFCSSKWCAQAKTLFEGDDATCGFAHRSSNIEPLDRSHAAIEGQLLVAVDIQRLR